MKTLITNRKDLHKAIDRIGDNALKIKRLTEENKALHAQAQNWCRDNPDEAFAGEGTYLEDATEKYVYRMEKQTPALRVMNHFTVEDVVRKLGAEPETQDYVTLTYDAAAIKADFGTTAAKRKKIEAYGLCFTNPSDHLAIGLIPSKT